MRKIGIACGLLIAGVIGFSVGKLSVSTPPVSAPVYKVSQTEMDLRDVIGALQPFAKPDRFFGNKFGVQATMWGDGSVNLSLTTGEHVELQGRGATVREAADDMKSKSGAIAGALQALR